MCPEERRAWVALIAFVIVASVCGLLLAIGHQALHWERRHLYLMCLSLTAVAHIALLVFSVIDRKRLGKAGVVRDERDDRILTRANGIAWRLGAAWLLGGCMLIFMSGTYRTAGDTDVSSLLLVVLGASLLVMISQAIACIVAYRMQRGDS